MEAAKKAQRTLATLDLWDRTRLLHAIADVLERRAPELARVLCQDQGKPYRTEALAEVQVTIVSIRETAELARFFTTDVLPVNDSRKRVWSVRQPRGICGVITPWNFPILIPIEYIAPALAMRNAVVWVPAPTTSVCGAKLMECIEEAGVPAGV